MCTMQAFIQTWRAACDSGVPAKLVIPVGTFLTSPVVFQGPCKSTEPIVVEVQGNVKATSDLSEYSSGQWILFEIIDGLTLNGGGAFDGQGGAVWKYNDCHQNKQCQPLPSVCIALATEFINPWPAQLESHFSHKPSLLSMWR